MAPDQGPGQLTTERDAEQTRLVVEVARDVFGDSLAGAYLHGSAVLGGMHPTSDVDVLAVIDRHSTYDDRRELIKRLMPISGPPTPESALRPVELTVVTQSEVRPWRYRPRMEFQYGEWLKADYESGLVPAPEPNADLAPLLAVVLIGNHPLVGPPPAELLDAVPPADLRAAIVEGIPGLMADLETDTRNVLLTLVRIWHTVATGQITSKDRAASWATDRLSGPARAAVAQARDQYLVGTHGDWDALLAEARATARQIVDRIETALGWG